MLKQRHQYRILGIATIFALVGLAFFAGFLGASHWVAVESKGIGITLKSGHPRPFSIPWLFDDPVAFWTLGLSFATFALFLTTVRMAKSADRVADQNVKTLVATERAYITGGGGWVPGGPTLRQFVVDVKNNGKTPALLTHFFVEFANKTNLPSTPTYTNKYVHYDWLGANEEKDRIKVIDIPRMLNGKRADVIFGEFHYRDFNHDPHYFRFILSIGSMTTHPDIAMDSPAEYSHWT